MSRETRKPKDRDFVETVEGMLFCVSGYLHPPDRYIAYLKYSPALEGKWKGGHTTYRRELAYYHSDQVAKTIAFLEQFYPHYVYDCPVQDIRFSMVPHRLVRDYYLPERRLVEILTAPQDPLEEEVSALVSEVVAVTEIEEHTLGITGSILLRMHNPQFSDIDLLVYGLENAQKVRAALKEGRSAAIRPVTGRALEEWYQPKMEQFALSLKDVLHLASRKWNHGFFGNRYFSIHATRTDQEIEENYGDRIYRKAGMTTIRALVTDASQSLFIPAVYQIEQVEVLESETPLEPSMPLKEVVSYEGLFFDIVDDGQAIQARGKLERVNSEYYRLVVGTTIHRGKEYIAPVWAEED